MSKQENNHNGHQPAPNERELMLRAELEDKNQMLGLYDEQVDILVKEIMELHKKLRDKS